MMKIIEVSYEIEKFDTDLVEMMKEFGEFKLIDKLKHKRPIFAQDDPYYFDRYTYTYEWIIKPQFDKLAENLYNIAMNNDLLN